jgi:DNA-binding response OmpR family regulator
MVDYKTLSAQTGNLSLLLVEDYKPLLHDMAEMLEMFFKSVTLASDGKEALSLYRTQHDIHKKGFDLIISDIQMPFMDGVALSKSIRQLEPEQKIIILSAHTDRDYLLELINIGISQFITKPVNHEELMKTLYKVSRDIGNKNNMPVHGNMVYFENNYSWDKTKSLLRKDKESIALTRHEALLMEYLLKREEEVCSNEDIMQYFYANTVDISTKNIRNLVFKLRKKLPKSAVTSLYGMGYKIVPLSNI